MNSIRFYVRVTVHGQVIISNDRFLRTGNEYHMKETDIHVHCYVQRDSSNLTGND